MPTYNYGRFITAAINSVLAQTFTAWELIIIDDGSTDDTAAVVQQFTDPRIHYIYQENKGLPGARNTGIRQARGQFIAPLDSDDLFAPTKLEKQLAFMQANPDVGLAYNGRCTFNHDQHNLILTAAPPHATLTDLVNYYPFTPSDIFLRRQWGQKVNWYDESFVRNSEDLNFHIRLALAGCTFAGLPEPLVYRQVHKNRTFSQLDKKLDTALRALNTAFDHPNCPPDLLALKNKAHSHHYFSFAFLAAIQNETERAQQWWATAAKLGTNPVATAANPLSPFVFMSIQGDSDHETRLQNIATALPQPVSDVDLRQAIDRGYFLRGVLHFLWDRPTLGHHCWQAASPAPLTNHDINALTEQFHLHDQYNRKENLNNQLQTMLRAAPQYQLSAQFTTIWARYHINKAFNYYQTKQYRAVPSSIIQACRHDTTYLKNRGVWSIFLRSLMHKLFNLKVLHV